jgi:hypothetical protein
MEFHGRRQGLRFYPHHYRQKSRISGKVFHPES